MGTPRNVPHPAIQGSRHPAAKLTENAVREIRAVWVKRHGLRAERYRLRSELARVSDELATLPTYAQLAVEYGVSERQIYSVMTYENWRHTP